MALDMQLLEKAAKDLGVRYEPITDRPLVVGEIYLAQRNGSVKLLTCKNDDRENGWVLPVELDYSYDTHECLRVIN